MMRWSVVAAVVGCSLGCGAAAEVVQVGADPGAAGASGLDTSAADEITSARFERRICDGSAGIRLALGLAGGGMFLPFTSVLHDLGHIFLYVDGHCRYWAHQPVPDTDNYSRWRPYREGVLTPADEQRLHDSVNYDGVPEDQCGPRRQLPDAPRTFLWDGREDKRCSDDRFDATAALRTELHNAATPVNGPLRIQVGQGFHAEPPVAYDWPLTTPIDQFVIEYGETRSFRIDDVTAVAALRALRERALADAEATSRPLTVIGIRLSEGSDSYFMSVRDELPFVSADGSWRPTL
jgi:hypothetical protein